MDTSLIYSKTAKGMAALKAGAKSLSKAHAKALALIDGKSTIESITFMLDGGSEQNFIGALQELEKLELIRLFVDADMEAADKSMPVEPVRKAGVSSVLPALEVIELTPEESVQAWAEAKRGARALAEKGFYTTKAPLTQNASGQTRAGVRVLVVEDDEATAQLLEFLLREHGFLAKRAADSEGAFTELARQPLPDLVLLDVMLPGKDGFDILHHIRSDTRLRELPVIMVTAKISDDNVMRGLKGGADGYIFKPFKWDALYGCIKSVCIV